MKAIELPLSFKKNNKKKHQTTSKLGEEVYENGFLDSKF